MEPSVFPSIDYNTKASWFTPLKLGAHRRSQAVMHRFIAKMEEMEVDFQELKRRIHRVNKTQSSENEQEDELKLILKVKLERINANTKFAVPEILEKLEKARCIFLEERSSEELAEHFLVQIRLLVRCYQEGVIFYFCRRQQKPMDLMDYLEILVLTPNGRALLQSDKQLLFEYGNAYVLAISRKLSLLYPKNEELEKLFSEMIALWCNSQEDFKEVMQNVQSIEQLIVKVHVINDGIQTALDKNIEVLRLQISHLTKPKKGIVLETPVFDIWARLFKENDLVDNPENDKTLEGIRNVLKEITETEKEFKTKIRLIADTALFQALVKEGVLQENEKELLQKGWLELALSSEKLLLLLQAPAETLSRQLENSFLAFSPQEIETHLENINALVITFLPTDRLLKKIKENKKGEQMLIGFSAVNRCDIFDIWIRPMQRLLRYILILTELQNRLKDELIKEALEKRISYLKKWAEAINLLRR